MNNDKSAKRNLREGEGEIGESQSSLCPACGAEVRRSSARFCSTCGRTLDAHGYRPADSLRASYHQHRVRIVVKAATPKRVRAPRRIVCAGVTPRKTIFPHNLNAATATALAFVVYSLVPYLGILFCPGAIVMGGVGLFQTSSTEQHVGRHASALSMLIGLLLFCVQIFLWLLLYRVPQF